MPMLSARRIQHVTFMYHKIKAMTNPLLFLGHISLVTRPGDHRRVGDSQWCQHRELVCTCTHIHVRTCPHMTHAITHKSYTCTHIYTIHMIKHTLRHTLHSYMHKCTQTMKGVRNWDLLSLDVYIQNYFIFSYEKKKWTAVTEDLTSES